MPDRVRRAAHGESQANPDRAAGPGKLKSITNRTMIVGIASALPVPGVHQKGL